MADDERAPELQEDKQEVDGQNEVRPASVSSSSKVSFPAQGEDAGEDAAVDESSDPVEEPGSASEESASHTDMAVSQPDVSATADSVDHLPEEQEGLETNPADSNVQATETEQSDALHPEDDPNTAGSSVEEDSPSAAATGAEEEISEEGLHAVPEEKPADDDVAMEDNAELMPTVREEPEGTVDDAGADKEPESEEQSVPPEVSGPEFEDEERKMETLVESEDVENNLHVAEEEDDEQRVERGLEEGDDNDKQSPGHHSRTYSPDGVREDEENVELEELFTGRDEQEECEEEMEEIEPPESIRNREELLEKYHQALTERQQLQERNYQLQHRLTEVFRQRRSDDVRVEERNTSDQNNRYLNYMASLDGLHNRAAADDRMLQNQIDELLALYADKEDEVNAERLRLVEYKKHVALSAIGGRSGKQLQQQDIEQILAADDKKELEVIAVRLENIKLKNKLKKQEAQLKSKEELAEGLHLIDFEQLKIENQTYNEKIEERNEELQKLRRKITNTVQVLTHLKEKLQFVQGENQVEKERLHDIEQLVAKKRDALSRTKQVRDSLRIDNQRMHQSSGLLANKQLLRDFEDRYEDVQRLQRQLSQLKMNHAELTLSLDGVRRRIDATKTV